METTTSSSTATTMSMSNHNAVGAGASAAAAASTTATTTTTSSNKNAKPHELQKHENHGEHEQDKFSSGEIVIIDSKLKANTSSGSRSSCCNNTVVLTTETSGVEEVSTNEDSQNTCKKSSLDSQSSQGATLVPNFRVGGGVENIIIGAPDILLPHQQLVKTTSDNECASLVDSSLGTETETEEPGVTTASTNGDLLSSLQSSEPEEMPLSLVSWYSEPGDCSSSIAGKNHCCQHSLNSEHSKFNNHSQGDLDSSVTPTTGAKEDFTSEEKENKTPSSSSATIKKDSAKGQKCSETVSFAPATATGTKRSNIAQRSTCHSTSTTSSSKRTSASSCSNSKIPGKMHVQAFEQKSETNSLIANNTSGGASGGGCSLTELNKDGRQRLECPRCSRRSKSGTTTPATAPPKSSLARRSHHHTSSQMMMNGGGSHGGGGGGHHNLGAIGRELKKPIKSILKSESRSGGSGGSGSGSEKQSSMDSLGSNSGVGNSNTMTRSDTGPRTKFYINNSNDNIISYPEDKMVAKLKRIEKFATLRVRKSRSSSSGGGGYNKVLSEESNTSGSDRRVRTSSESEGSCAIPDLMTKSMSFLEKSTTPFSSLHHHSQRSAIPNSSGPSSLKRQSSLKSRKPSPGWEPNTTRTTALRLLKLQENKARTGGVGSSANFHIVGQYQGASGSTHSGSGESIANHHSITTVTTTSAPSNRSGRNTSSKSSSSCSKERGNSSSAKVFSKLSSAMGQTASSSMKRLKQEKSVQTDSIVDAIDSTTSISNISNTNSATISKVDSPEPTSSPEPPIFDASATIITLDQQTEQIKRLESLVKRYKTSALRFQKEFERTENKNIELKKQLQETQMESSEMLEFLQAEKSTLAESLVEVETECKKLTRELESVVKESQSRCSSLVRLSEQHKQEALKAQTLLHRLESHSNQKISQQLTQLTKGTEAILGIKQQILSLVETLMKTYKVSQERLASDGFGEGVGGTNADDTQLRCTLLVPLIKSLSKAFEAFKLQLKNNSGSQQSQIPDNNHEHSSSSSAATHASELSIYTTLASTCTTTNSTGINSTSKATSNSLQNLNQAILDREKAETIGLDSILVPTKTSTNSTSTQLSLEDELEQLQFALRKLCTVIRIIVIHCDQKVSNVASDILQVLKAETDKLDFSLDTSFHDNSNSTSTLVN